jgi:hypothetical protein
MILVWVFHIPYIIQRSKEAKIISICLEVSFRFMCSTCLGSTQCLAMPRSQRGELAWEPAVGNPFLRPFQRPKKAMEYHSVVVGLVKEGFIIRNDMQMQDPRNGSYIWIYLQWSRCYPVLNGVRSICKWILNIKGVLVEGCWFLNSWSGGGSTKWQRHFQHS